VGYFVGYLSGYLRRAPPGSSLSRGFAPLPFLKRSVDSGRKIGDRLIEIEVRHLPIVFLGDLFGMTADLRRYVRG
jgi:hypothetical protein